MELWDIGVVFFGRKRGKLKRGYYRFELAIEKEIPPDLEKYKARALEIMAENFRDAKLAVISCEAAELISDSIIRRKLFDPRNHQLNFKP